MLYLSLILVATGLFLVVSSIFLKRDVRRGLTAGDRFIPNDDFQFGGDLHRSTAGRERSGGAVGKHPARDGAVKGTGASTETAPLEDFRGDDEEAAGVISTERVGILDELDADLNDKYSDDARKIADVPRGGGEPGKAVLYEDASGLVDYENGESSIDPSLEAYNKLKRLGSGEVEIAAESLIIRIGKAVHRFDFYKVQDYRIGDNYIALYLKGSRAVRLFLVDANPDLRFTMQAAVEDYFRSAS